jgi:steroid delta-isomerase-like uncharacterized protein
MRWFNDVWNAEDVGVLHDITTEDFALSDPCCWSELFVGRERVRKVVEEYLGAYKSFQYDVENMMASADGSVVLCRWQARAMHLGSFMGSPASGRIEQIAGMTTFLLQNGKICRIECFREGLAQDSHGSCADYGY